MAVPVNDYKGDLEKKKEVHYMATTFVTEKKQKVLDTFEKILPMTTNREDELLLSYMEGILKFKTNQQDHDQKPA